ncbi:hypothetical protein D3C86_1787920 [compost metagenome]
MGYQAGRSAGPEHTQGRLVTHQEGQARGGRGLAAKHGQLKWRHRPQLLQQGGIGVGQARYNEQSVRLIEAF